MRFGFEYNYVTHDYAVNKIGSSDPKFGIELEAQTPEITIDNLCEFPDIEVNGTKFIEVVTSDSSIPGRGGEFKTHAFSWRWFQGNRERIAEALDKLAKDIGVFAFDNCGMHVHISPREKYPYFPYLCFILSGFLFEISGRTNGRWCNIEPLYYSFPGGATGGLCVNSTWGTYEFRGFAGTLDPELIIDRVELLKVVLDLSKHKPPADIYFRFRDKLQERRSPWLSLLEDYMNQFEEDLLMVPKDIEDSEAIYCPKSERLIIKSESYY